MWILGVRMVIQASTQQAALAFGDISDKLKVLALKTRVFLWVAESPIFKETILINSKMARSISIHDWHSLWGKHRFLTGYDLHFSWWTITQFSSNFPRIFASFFRFPHVFPIISGLFPACHRWPKNPTGTPAARKRGPGGNLPRPRRRSGWDLGIRNIMVMDIW